MALVLTALCFTILLNTPTAYAEGENETKQTEDYELSGKKIGVQSGTTAERKMAVYEEASRSDIERYYALSDAADNAADFKDLEVHLYLACGDSPDGLSATLSRS